MNALRLLLQFKHTRFLSNVNVHRKWHQNSISFTYLISVSVLCLVNALCKFSIQFSHVGVHLCVHAQVGLRNWLVSVCHQHSGELQQIRQFLESSFHSDLTTFLCLIDWMLSLEKLAFLIKLFTVSPMMPHIESKKHDQFFFIFYFLTTKEVRALLVLIYNIMCLNATIITYSL